MRCTHNPHVTCHKNISKRWSTNQLSVWKSQSVSYSAAAKSSSMSQRESVRTGPVPVWSSNLWTAAKVWHKHTIRSIKTRQTAKSDFSFLTVRVLWYFGRKSQTVQVTSLPLTSDAYKRKHFLLSLFSLTWMSNRVVSIICFAIRNV